MAQATIRVLAGCLDPTLSTTNQNTRHNDDADDDQDRNEAVDLGISTAPSPCTSAFISLAKSAASRAPFGPTPLSQSESRPPSVTPFSGSTCSSRGNRTLAPHPLSSSSSINNPTQNNYQKHVGLVWRWRGAEAQGHAQECDPRSARAAGDAAEAREASPDTD